MNVVFNDNDGPLSCLDLLPVRFKAWWKVKSPWFIMDWSRRGLARIGGCFVAKKLRVVSDGTDKDNEVVERTVNYCNLECHNI